MRYHYRHVLVVHHAGVIVLLWMVIIVLSPPSSEGGISLQMMAVAGFSPAASWVCSSGRKTTTTPITTTALSSSKPSRENQDDERAIPIKETTTESSEEEPSTTTTTTTRLVMIDDVAAYCCVRPPTNYRSIPVVKQFARWTWRQRVPILRILHWKDPWTPVDSCINLECLWWKVLSTTNPSSPCYEGSPSSGHSYTYDLLPRPSRRFITSLRRFHPRWIHALLEVRMAYLNQAIQAERMQVNDNDNSNSNSTMTGLRVISLGAGYDVRSIRLLNEEESSTPATGNSDKQPSLILECFEFDLPATIDSKQQLIEQRLLKRQPKRRRQQIMKKQERGRDRKEEMTPSTQLKLPTMIGLDLNDTVELQRQLQQIFRKKDKEEIDNQYHTIFVVEGVLMYLDEGKAAAVLQACADAARNSSGESSSSASSASLCFADRLFDRNDCDPIPLRDDLARTGWKLHEWAPNPHANAKHMGIARLL